jgi:hypothetical protein
VSASLILPRCVYRYRPAQLTASGEGGAGQGGALRTEAGCRAPQHSQVSAQLCFGGASRTAPPQAENARCRLSSSYSWQA